jgi:hypothetical protein
MNGEMDEVEDQRKERRTGTGSEHLEERGRKKSITSFNM